MSDLDNNIKLATELLSNKIQETLSGTNANFHNNHGDSNKIEEIVAHDIIHKAIQTTIETFVEGKIALEAIAETTECKKAADIASATVKIKKENPEKSVTDCYNEATKNQ